MIVATKAIVFSALKYSEADLIVCCFTETAGIKTYLLRNVLKSKKGALKPSLFQPLTQLEVVANHKNKGSLEYLKEAKIFHPYKTLHTDNIKTGLVMFLSEMLKNCIKEEEANVDLYNYITSTLNWLDENDEVANFHIFFLLKLSAHLGFYPDASEIQHQYFNLVEGNFQSSDAYAPCIKDEAVEGLKLFFDIKLNEIGQIKLSKKTRLESLNLLLTYYKFHVHGYQHPKSLSVLIQL